MKPVTFEAMRFDGSLDSYLAILQWMKDCGDTFALANEIRFSTPLILMQTCEGTKAASPGDWIIRGQENEFFPVRSSSR